MTIGLYDFTVPIFLRGLVNMAALLEKGRTHADEHGMAHSELTEARLFPDMDPLTKQVQRTADAAKLAVLRFADLPPVPMEDTETTFDELQARIAATIQIVRSVTREELDGREETEVILRISAGEMPMSALNYLRGFAMPNFYFHMTTAYALLRHKGVPVGKLDYLGRS